jgi:hypothetical protein
MPHRVDDPVMGFYQALVEARIPFEMVHDGLLDDEHVSQFRTSILPNIAALSSCSGRCPNARAWFAHCGYGLR